MCQIVCHSYCSVEEITLESGIAEYGFQSAISWASAYIFSSLQAQIKCECALFLVIFTDFSHKLFTFELLLEAYVRLVQLVVTSKSRI